MTICSFIEKEGELFACNDELWREENGSLSRQRPCASHLRRPGQRLPINRSRGRQSALTTQSARTDVRGYDVHGWLPRFCMSMNVAWRRLGRAPLAGCSDELRRSAETPLRETVHGRPSFAFAHALGP